MKPKRQVLFGFLAAMLSAAVIFGSLSLSLAETGLNLAMQITPTLISGLKFPTMTPTTNPATEIPGETSVSTLFTPSIPATITPVVPFTTPPEPPTSCPPPAGWSPVEIQLGDTLDSLALAFNATPDALIQANCLVSEELIPGTYLYVPGIPPTKSPIKCGAPSGWVLYLVQPGDTLFRIGLYFGVTVADLQLANCLGDSTTIRIGQKIFVPYVYTNTPTNVPTRTETMTQLPSNTPTEIPSASSTLQPTSAPTLTPYSSNTPVHHSPTPTSSPTPEPTALSTPPSPTLPPTHTPTVTPKNTPPDTLTPTETVTPSPTGTPTPTPVPSSTNTILPSATPTVTDTPEPATLTPTSTL